MFGVGILPMAQFAFQWMGGTSEEGGIVSKCLEKVSFALGEKARLDALLIICGDKIVYQWYGEGNGRHKPHYTASLAKALVGGTSLVLALGDGRLKLDDPAYKYVPEWKSDPLKSRITIFHLATHSSGIEDSVPRDPGSWKEKFWKYPHHYALARDVAPVLFEPGTRYHYSNPGMGMLSYSLTAALGSSPQTDVKTLLHQRVMRPMGVADNSWHIAAYGGGRPVEVDELKIYANWGGASFSPDAVARVGRLMLCKGKWEGKQLLDAKTVEKATSDVGAPVPDRSDGPNPRSGLCWWVNTDGIWENVPRDAFAGAGAGNQVLFVVPSLDLIVVRFGEQIDPKSFWGGLVEYLFKPVIEALA